MDITPIIKACNDGWKKIQELNPEVPDAVIIVGSGGRSAKNLYGHFARDRWVNDDSTVHEVLIVAEHLSREPELIFTTLLHEATHGLAAARNIKDVSGRVHNKKFAVLCSEMLLLPPEERNQSIGWSAATLSEHAKEVYADEIKALGEALGPFRSLDVVGKKEGVKSTWIAECNCRKIRVPKKSISNYRKLNIGCNDCASEFKFTPEDLAYLQEEFA